MSSGIAKNRDRSGKDEQRMLLDFLKVMLQCKATLSHERGAPIMRNHPEPLNQRS